MLNESSEIRSLDECEVDLVGGGFDSSKWGFGTRVLYEAAMMGALGPVGEAAAITVTEAWLVS